MKQMFTNITNKTVFVGGKMIAPGITREVDIITAKPSEGALFDFADLLSSAVTDLPDKLDGLNLEQLEGALTAEQGGQKRKGAIKAIETAIEDLETNLDLAEFSRSLSGVENLDELMLKVADNDAKVLMVEHEIALRAENDKA